MRSSKKPKKHQALTRRKPRQERALDKVELIFQATTALVEQSGIETLTTNAVAEKAGVSIGTLYQYFGDKNTILDALIGREMAQLSERVIEAFKGAVPERPGARIPILMEAIMKSYGGKAGITGNCLSTLWRKALQRGSTRYWQSWLPCLPAGILLCPAAHRSAVQTRLY